MKKSKKIGFLAALACVTAAAGTGLMTNETVQADSLGGIAITSFEMENGASVRYKSSDGQNGIRFTAMLDSGVYKQLEELEKDTEKNVTVNYGMLIVPANYVKANDLTKETVFGSGAVYTLIDCDPTSDEHADGCNKTHITGITAETMTVSGDTATLKGSLVGLLDANRDREFVGRAYIEYTVDGTKEYVFADYTDGEVKNNTRSMTYVAQLYLEDNGADETHELYSSYVAPYVSVPQEYKVEHYIPTNPDEETPVYSESATYTETKYGTLNQRVTASNIAKLQGEAFDEYDIWANATMEGDKAKANLSDIVYANGNTVLKCYYKKVSNVLFDGSNTDDFTLLEAAHDDVSTLGGRLTENTVVEQVEDNGNTVTKISSVDQNLYRDGLLDIKFSEEKLALAENANWDYLTIRMKITAEYADSGIYTNMNDDAKAAEQAKIAAIQSVSLYSKDIVIAQVGLNSWVNVIIPKAKLNMSDTWHEDTETWGRTSYLLSNKETTKDKAGFDTAFANAYGENTAGGVFFHIGDFALLTDNSLADCGAQLNGNALSGGAAKTCHDVKVTYYIDQITWDVDYTAPVVTASTDILTAEEDGAEVSYTPAYSVTDNALPGKMILPNGGVYESLINYSHEVYEVSGGTRTALKATNGVYTLIKGKSYELEVTANDWSVADIDGNESTTTFTITFTEPNPPRTNFAFDDDTDNGLLTSANSATGYTVTYLTDYEGKEGVLKMETSLLANQNYGADFILNFDEFVIENIVKNFNENDDFTFTITARFEFGKVNSTNFGAFGVNFYGGKIGYIGGENLTQVNVKDGNGAWLSGETKMNADTWYTITFTKDILTSYCGWDDEAQMRKELAGQDYFIRFGGNMCVDKTTAGTPVTYYIDEISYSVA